MNAAHSHAQIPEYVGSFRFDLHHGHGELYNFEASLENVHYGEAISTTHLASFVPARQGRKMYRGTFVRGKRSGHGVEFDAHGDKIYDVSSTPHDCRRIFLRMLTEQHIVCTLFLCVRIRENIDSAIDTGGESPTYQEATCTRCAIRR